MEVLYFYLVFLTFIDNSNCYLNVTCPVDQTIGQLQNIDILAIWDYAWTVLVGIKTVYLEDDMGETFDPNGIPKTFYCSGSLLKPFLVLTSASCLQNLMEDYELKNVFVYGDYNRSESAKFIRMPKIHSLFELKNPEDTEFNCGISGDLRPMKYEKRNIYYYNYGDEYKKSDPDIALIGLRRSILFNLTNKRSVSIAGACHSINYNNCVVTELQEKNRLNFTIKCSVTFEDRIVNDGFMEESFKEKTGKLKCRIPFGTEFFGGNPIVCATISDPKKYVQIGILGVSEYGKKVYTYLPGIPL